MDLNTGCVIMCRKVTEIPVTNVVIKAVEAMAHNQGFKNLKFKNRHGVIFHDAGWLAGVDYEDEDEREENADEDEEYEDSEEQDIELEEAENIDPREIDDINEDEANPNEHQDAGEHQEDDGDHQERKENIGIEELSGEEPRVPSESETLIHQTMSLTLVTSRVGHPTWMQNDKIQARMNISRESKIFRLSTDCRIEVYT